MSKGFILKTAAVALCVSVLILTGCRGGVNEAAAVKNNSEEGVRVNVTSSGDGQEAVKGVVRSTEPERDRVQAESDDSEREESKDGREPKVTSEAEPSEDGDSVLTEEDRGTVDGSAPVGTGEGSEDDSASAVYDYSDMGYEEYTDDAGEWDESEWMDGQEQSEPTVSELVESEYEQSYDDGNEQYGDSEYSEETSDGWSDGATDNLIYQGEFSVTAYCSCSICTGAYSSGYTASGAWATEGRTIACNIYPFGTQLMIDGHIYTVEDTGWSPYGDAWIDLFFESHESALAYGCRTVDVYLVN